MTQRNEGYPAKICKSCLAPKNNQVSCHGHFFFSVPLDPFRHIIQSPPLDPSGRASRRPGSLRAAKYLCERSWWRPNRCRQLAWSKFFVARAMRVSQKMGKGWKTPGSSTKKIMSQNRNAQHLRKIQNVKVKLAKIMWCFKPNCWTNTHSWTSPSSIGIALVHRPWKRLKTTTVTTQNLKAKFVIFPCWSWQSTKNWGNIRGRCGFCYWSCFAGSWDAPSWGVMFGQIRTNTHCEQTAPAPANGPKPW